MKLMRVLMPLLFSMLFNSAAAQNPNTKHFDKDGLSFDYPISWQITDQSTGQMQFLELSNGEVVIRVRAPRESLKTPEKEAHAKKLMHDQYIDDFAAQLSQAGMNPKRSPLTSQIAGVDAEGVRLSAVLDGQPGGMDSYYRIISDRLVDLSIIGSEKDVAKSAAAWELVRASIKVEPPPQPKAPAKPSPTPRP